MPSKSETMASEPGAGRGLGFRSLTPTRYLLGRAVDRVAGELSASVHIDSKGYCPNCLTKGMPILVRQYSSKAGWLTTV